MNNSSSNNSGIIITIIVVGLMIAAVTLVFKGGENQTSPTTFSANNTSDNMAGHHPGSEAPSQSTAGGGKFAELVGKAVPSFTSLERKGKNTVLFFNEGLMCYPACWNQIAAFSKDNRFKENNTEVISIVTDASSDWEQAVKKMPDLAATTVVFDTDRAMSKEFGVLNLESSMHKGQFPGHTYLIVDKNGIVRFAMDDPNMALNNDKLIEEIKKL